MTTAHQTNLASLYDNGKGHNTMETIVYIVTASHVLAGVDAAICI